MCAVTLHTQTTSGFDTYTLPSTLPKRTHHLYVPIMFPLEHFQSAEQPSVAPQQVNDKAQQQTARSVHASSAHVSKTTVCTWEATGELVCADGPAPPSVPQRTFDAFDVPNSNYQPVAYRKSLTTYNSLRSPCCGVPCDGGCDATGRSVDSSGAIQSVRGPGAGACGDSNSESLNSQFSLLMK